MKPAAGHPEQRGEEGRTWKGHPVQRAREHRQEGARRDRKDALLPSVTSVPDKADDHGTGSKWESRDEAACRSFQLTSCSQTSSSSQRGKGPSLFGSGSSPLPPSLHSFTHSFVLSVIQYILTESAPWTGLAGLRTGGDQVTRTTPASRSGDQPGLMPQEAQSTFTEMVMFPCKLQLPRGLEPRWGFGGKVTTPSCYLTLTENKSRRVGNIVNGKSERNLPKNRNEKIFSRM